jgi:hypothetical protein
VLDRTGTRKRCSRSEIRFFKPRLIVFFAEDYNIGLDDKDERDPRSGSVMINGPIEFERTKEC